MTQPCEICAKELADKRSLRRHKQRVHGVQPEFPALECSTCGFETHNILIMNQHTRREHGGEVQNQCAYCTLVFNNQSNFHQHLKNAHGLLFGTEAKAIIKQYQYSRQFEVLWRSTRLRVMITLTFCLS